MCRYQTTKDIAVTHCHMGLPAHPAGRIMSKIMLMMTAGTCQAFF